MIIKRLLCAFYFQQYIYAERFFSCPLSPILNQLLY